MNDGIPSSAMHFEGLRHLIALMTSPAKRGPVGKMSDIIRSARVQTEKLC
jgi:hypothetical protein